MASRPDPRVMWAQLAGTVVVPCVAGALFLRALHADRVLRAADRLTGWLARP